MLYLDLDELQHLVGSKVISNRRWSTASLLPEDHLALARTEAHSHHSDSTVQLRQRVADIVERETGTQPSGSIRMLTQPRYFGYYFSPLNLYYCFDNTDQQLEAIVAEVSNTPWREQHLYVLWQGNRNKADGYSYSHPKSFHVSPFMDMNFDYQWKLDQPRHKLSVSLANRCHDGETLFSAKLQLNRRELSRASMARLTVRYPLMTAQIMGAIYFQAFRLWWKACPYYPHPKNQSSLPQANTAN